VTRRIFTAAVGVALLHALDDAFVGRQPGVDLDQHAVAALVSVVVAAGAILAFGRVRPGVRAALAVGLGVPALVNGAMHVVHVDFQGLERSDLTGVLAAVAGIVLIGLGAAIPWLGRAERSRRPWVTRAVALPAGFLFAFVLVLPVGMAVMETHKPREDVSSPPNAAFADVSFESTDGLRLSGWYRPPRNGATVLVIHGGGGDRTGAMDHAKLLDRHGYGVLMYDARGRGESEGTPNSYGWDWERDAAGAMRWLHAQPGAGRIGALGLSSGADTVVDLAAHDASVAAVVTDGLALRTMEDAENLDGGLKTESLTGWLMFQAVGVMSGSEPSEPLQELVPRIHAPLLMISAGESAERDYNELYAEVANEPFEHWNLPEAGHTSAVRDEPAEYERRVTRFLDAALLSGR
jgi:dienelactone hydrolase